MKYTMKKGLALASAYAALPTIAFAQDVEDILLDIDEILQTLIPILITLAVIFFIWGVAQYIMASGDAEQQRAARSTMIWGVIALFVIVSVWGLVGVLQETFVGEGTADTTPTPRP